MALSAALLVAAVLAAAIWSLPRLKSSWRLYRMMSKLPGPRGLPVIGNLLDLGTSADVTYNNILTLRAKYSTLIRLWVTPFIPLVFLLDPEDVKTILGNPRLVNKPEEYGAMKAVFGATVMMHPREIWKPIRNAMANSLHKSVVASFVPIFHKSAADLTNRLEELADKGSVFDVTLLCGWAANSSVIETILSSNHSDVSEEEKKNYLDLVQKINTTVMKRLMRPWLYNDWIYSFTKDWTVFNRCQNFFEALIQRVVSKKREMLKSRRAGLEGQIQEKGRQSFLDHILTSDTPFKGDLETEARFLMLAASASSMDALSFIFYVLSIRQDWQANLIKELDEVFGGDPERAVEDSDLPHLEATERFIKEVLRMLPPVPTFGRAVPEDIALPSGHTLPRGCIAVFSLPAIHWDPRSFPRPDEFDPDRFLPENSRGRHPFAFIPFSAGPRNCVAHLYAMAFLKTSVATVLRRVCVRPAPGTPARVRDVPVSANITLSIRGGAHVRVERRAVRV